MFGKGKTMLKVYGVPVSVHTRKVIVTAMLKNISYELVPVIPYNPPSNWAELSPTGLIPVIDHEGYVLQDSTAICLYLDRISPRPPLFPENAREAGRALWFNAYAGDIFRNVVHGLFFQKVIRPAVLKQGEPDQAVIDSILDGPAARMFAYVDAHATGRWLSGERLTLGDIAMVSTLINFLYLGFEIDRSRFPRLSAYMANALSAAPFKDALAAEAPVADQMGLSRDFFLRSASG
jgi:glutathione S-transferase